jgi:outer membrane protein X
MKKSFLCVVVALFTLSLSAQQKGAIRVGFNAGLGLPNAGFGVGGDFDIRYNLMDNLNVGVKFSGDALMKDLQIDRMNNNVYATASAISSTLLSADYYFNKGTNRFAPYLGGGLGLYKIMNIGMVATGSNSTVSTPTNTTIYPSYSKFGGLIRGGFESGHFRMGLELFLVPDSPVTPFDNTTSILSPTTGNSFLKFSLGFYFGGGHWKK